MVDILDENIDGISDETVDKVVIFFVVNVHTYILRAKIGCHQIENHEGELHSVELSGSANCCTLCWGGQ